MHCPGARELLSAHSLVSLSSNSILDGLSIREYFINTRRGAHHLPVDDYVMPYGRDCGDMLFH